MYGLDVRFDDVWPSCFGDVALLYTHSDRSDVRHSHGSSSKRVVARSTPYTVALSFLETRSCRVQSETLLFFMNDYNYSYDPELVISIRNGN